MEPQEYLGVLRKRWLAIVALAVLGGAAGYGYAQTLPTTYTSTSSVFVSTLQGDNTSELVQGSLYTQNIVQSYAALATMPAVLDPVIEDLDLNLDARQLGRTISANTPLNTVIIEITVSSYSADQAAEVADAVASSLATVAEDLSPQDAAGKPSISLQVVAPAHVPTVPSGPNTRLLAITGLAIGALLGLVYAFGRELLDTRIHGTADLLRVGNLQLMGTVPRGRRRQTDIVVLRASPHGPRAEAYRRIFTNIEFADVDNKVSSVVVTSALPGEGKSFTAINLAYAAAERVDRVLLIDADLRRPSVAEYLGVEGASGLTTVLRGEIETADAILPGRKGSPDVLPSGITPPNPGQLLASQTMANLLADLQEQYDFIVIDTPPVAPVMDALPLTRLVDGTIVVARFKVTRRGQLSRAIANLSGVNAHVLGVVLNRVEDRGDETYYSHDPQHDAAATSDGKRRPSWLRRSAGAPASDAAEPQEAADEPEMPGTLPDTDDPAGVDPASVGAIGGSVDDIDENAESLPPADEVDEADEGEALGRAEPEDRPADAESGEPTDSDGRIPADDDVVPEPSGHARESDALTGTQRTFRIRRSTSGRPGVPVEPELG
ncbi:polysaccharide biosynthesis tyrosine autokinase [Leifsonia sp. YIM 134122]|uniref:non-specific protein-tyrosine kinase n=1 Tax=Leifsonia stereocauli TaxID=3134136 RepID=A0ABU9W7L7_9MICO